ncbi:hypothetical protein BS47DRAFT_1362044 [Hydnum rufescens UP504]|uniref:Uncharacterized protein n=1 Tax=Hydnum rufescens UP504 TaxID=1448309 RepID=A0A9P6DU66_9AGAM|nr:hypothetical protein BS47DRAFT_1362044 [Hydnum rufescens UP504]
MGSSAGVLTQLWDRHLNPLVLGAFGNCLPQPLLTSEGWLCSNDLGGNTVWNAPNTTQFEALGKNASPLTVYPANHKPPQHFAPTFNLGIAFDQVRQVKTRNKDFYLLALENPDAGGERVLIGSEMGKVGSSEEDEAENGQRECNGEDDQEDNEIGSLDEQIGSPHVALFPFAALVADKDSHAQHSFWKTSVSQSSKQKRIIQQTDFIEYSFQLAEDDENGFGLMQATIGSEYESAQEGMRDTREEYGKLGNKEHTSIVGIGSMALAGWVKAPDIREPNGNLRDPL